MKNKMEKIYIFFTISEIYQIQNMALFNQFYYLNAFFIDFTLMFFLRNAIPNIALRFLDFCGKKSIDQKWFIKIQY